MRDKNKRPYDSKKEFYRGKRDNDFKNKDNVLNEKDQETDIIEGRNAVTEALNSNREINKVLVLQGDTDFSLKRIISRVREKGIMVQYVDRVKLDKASQTRSHQGIIAYVSPKQYSTLEDILNEAASKNEIPFVVILDGITDSNNFGSIIRTSVCAGVHGIIIPKRRAAALSSTVAKVSAGALEYMNIARVTNLNRTIEDLKKQGFCVVGADMNGETHYYNANLKEPLAIVIGSEGEGISRLVKENCDFIVDIPMKGKISSLNASVAAGLIIFEAAKQRG